MPKALKSCPKSNKSPNLVTLVGTDLILLFVELVNDDTDEEVEREEASEDDERDEVEVHVDVHLAMRLEKQTRDHLVSVTSVTRWLDYFSIFGHLQQ